jgi:hypothetical protein
MATRWEYLTMRWYYQRLNPPDPNEESAEWTHKHVTEIRRPGTTEAEVVATETWIWRKGMSELKPVQKARTDIFGLFNELGAHGWECFSIQPMGSAVAPRDGFETGSYPLDIRCYFKRGRDA